MADVVERKLTFRFHDTTPFVVTGSYTKMLTDNDMHILVVNNGHILVSGSSIAPRIERRSESSVRESYVKS